MARVSSPTKAAQGPEAGTTGANVKGEATEAIKHRAKELYRAGRKKSLEYAADRQCQVAAITGAAGAACVGAPAAGLGLFAGGAIGGAVGILPALFTFGLSIPAGAVIGAGCGMVFTGATGATVGFAGGSAIGYGGYARRTQISTLWKRASTKVGAAAHQATTKVVTLAGNLKSKAAHTFTVALSAARQRSGRFLSSATAKTKELASDKEVQAATASVVGGAVVLGTGGAATGLAAGGAVGAAVGLVPALFTFGLSIPIGAVVGGGCGLAAGTAVGSTTGAVAGGGAYATYKRRAAIRSFVSSAAKKARESAQSVCARVAGPK